MSKLVDTLIAQLELPRKVSAQVANHIIGMYEEDLDTIGRFLTDEMPGLEDYEHDLILSPLFTPKLGDQAVFADVLGAKSVGKSEWPGLIAQLAERGTSARLVTSDGQTHVVPLRDVVLERYVHRLRLDATIPELVMPLLKTAPAVDRPMLAAVARRAVLESVDRQAILERYLKSTMNGGVTGTVALLNLLESYRPADAADLLARLPHWIQVLREEIRSGGGPRPFFSSLIHGEHGGERDQRAADGLRLTAKEAELAFLEQLQQIFS